MSYLPYARVITMTPGLAVPTSHANYLAWWNRGYHTGMPKSCSTWVAPARAVA